MIAEVAILLTFSNLNVKNVHPPVNNASIIASVNLALMVTIYINHFA